MQHRHETNEGRTEMRTRTKRATIVAVLVGLLLVPLVDSDLRSRLDPGAAAPEDQSSDEIAVEATEAGAVARARQTGRRVEVAAARDEHTTLYAHPDGSYTRQHHIQPIRSLENGRWVGVDATLEKRADGRVAPRASTVDMSFSGGGDGPLATVSRLGRELRLSWPDRLPEPVLRGPRATYPDVLPDVDLVINAEVGSFSHVLVVRTRQAARNPRLAQVGLGVEAVGLELSADEGRLTARDQGSGTVVFEAPAPTMWDSGTGPAAGEELEPTRFAPESARRAPVGLRIEGRDRLVLTPDVGMLTDPDVRFPLYIDPQVGPEQYQGNYAMVDSGYPAQEYWAWAGAGNAEHQRVGLCPNDVNNGNNCDSSRIKRLFFEVPTGYYADPAIEIVDAQFHITLRHVENTSNTYGTELWRTDGINSSTNWGNQPIWRQHLSTTTALGTRECSVPDRNVVMDATEALRTASRDRLSKTTFGLKAGNNETWKRNNRRFCHNAFVSVRFNRKPLAPTALTSNPGGECRSGAAPPFTDKPPELTAYLSDPDTGDGEPLTAEFTVTWTPPGGTPQTKTWESGERPNQTPFSYDLGLPGTGVPDLPQNTVITWRVRASDGVVNGSKSWGPYSRDCQFVIDRTAPAGPDVDSAEYLPGDAADDGSPSTWSTCREDSAEHDGVGRYGSFTFKSADPDVVAYKYGFDTTPDQTVTAGTGTGRPATVTWSPADDGPHRIVVRAIDGAGQESRIDSTCLFLVRRGAQPVARWKLDDPVGSTRAADSTGDNPATAGSGTSFGALGPNGLPAAHLDGTGQGHLMTSTRGLVDTSQPFTVSAWARLDDGASNQSVVSQDGTGETGFVLAYEGGSTKKWVFSMRSTDGIALGVWSARSAVPAVVGRWTLLVASFDPVRDRMTLEVQVDGVTAAPATAANRSQWASHGSVQIGRSIHPTGYRDFLRGDLAGVELYDRLATASEISLPAEAQRIGYWDLDRLNAAGTTTREHRERLAHPEDDSGDRRALTVHGAELVTAQDPQDPEAPPPQQALMGESHLRFEGENEDHLASTGPLLGSRTSFTVAARVRVNGCTGEQVVLSQPGAVRSRFMLRCRDGRWELVMSHADDSTAGETVLPGPAGSAAVHRETGQHLAVTFNAVDGSVLLYIDGQQVAQGSHTAVWNGTVDRLHVGRGLRSDGTGAVGGHLSGDMDEIRVYAGVLSAEHVQQIASRTVLADK